jgi:hypothetical protein
MQGRIYTGATWGQAPLVKTFFFFKKKKKTIFNQNLKGAPGNHCAPTFFLSFNWSSRGEMRKYHPPTREKLRRKRARRVARVPRARRRRKLEIHGKELQGVEHLDREEGQGHHPLQIHSFGHHYRGMNSNPKPHISQLLSLV